MKNLISESEILSSIIKYLYLKGIFVTRMHTQGVWDQNRKILRKNQSMKGVSDLIGLLPNGKFLAIEVKTEKGIVSSDQKAYLDSINKNNGIGIIARSLKDVEDFILKYEKDELESYLSTLKPPKIHIDF